MLDRTDGWGISSRDASRARSLELGPVCFWRGGAVRASDSIRRLSWPERGRPRGRRLSAGQSRGEWGPDARAGNASAERLAPAAARMAAREPRIPRDIRAPRRFAAISCRNL